MAMGMASSMSSFDLDKINITPFELSLMKRDIIDFIMKDLLSIQAYSQYRYRALLGLGLKVSQESGVDVIEDDEKVHMTLYITFSLPKWQIEELAKRRKLRRLRLPKPHPLTKQKIRDMVESAKMMEEELRKMIEEMKKAKK